jgi:tetratricopeptide (TPR) repeat protein
MSAPGPQRRAPRDVVGGRRCSDCGTVLAADNTARLCSRCYKGRRDELGSPPVLKDEFFATDEFRAAFASQHIGKVFRAYRNHPRWLRIFGKALNQELFGGWLNLKQAQVSKIETAPRPGQNLETLRNYATILHLPWHMLWFKPPGQSRLNPPRLLRATDDLVVPAFRDGAVVVTSGSDSFGLITLGQHRDVGGPAAAGHGSMPVRPELLAHYESLTDNYRQIDYQVGARAVYGDTVTHLNRLLRTADRVPSELYGRYMALLGDTAQLAAWLAIDSQDYPAARHFCSIALSSAEEGEDPTLRAYALGVMSYIHLHARRGNEAIRLLDSALRIANTPRFGVNPVVRSWLYEALAEAHACAGNHEAGAKALVEAERLFDAVQADGVPPWLGFYNAREHVTRLIGRCLVRLGDGRAAIAALESACELLPEQYVRERSGTLIDLATAHLLESGGAAAPPEPEAAAEAAREAWQLALVTDSGRNQRRIRELLSAFTPYVHLESVRSLTDEVQ